MNSTELETARAEALAADKCFSKTRLRDELRMKPKPNAVPVAYYKNDYGVQFGVYRIADCVPMRTQCQAQTTEKQLRARERLSVQTRMKSKKAKVSSKALSWLDDNPVFLDTETTGLDDVAQVIELAIVDAAGEILMDTRLQATVPIYDEAMAVHGIDDAALTQAPTWPVIAGQVEALLRGRRVIIFNCDFDYRILWQTAAAFNDPGLWLKELKTCCAMYLAADFFGPTNRHGTISLADATAMAGVGWRGSAHSAATDALATADLVCAIASYRTELDRSLANLLE